MNDDPAGEHPGAPPEVIRHDIGGWVSGPSLTPEPVPADRVGAGDVLVLDDGTCAEVTGVRSGFYQFPEGRGQGVAIGWKSGPVASGVMFRKASDTLQRAVPK